MAKRVVVADDDRDICTVVETALVSAGLEVDVYHDGRSAFEAIVAEPPDLAILDISMPRMDGLEVVRTLRSVPVTAELPIVLFTGAAYDRDKGFEAGTNYFVVKPFSMRALREYVKKILDLP